MLCQPVGASLRGDLCAFLDAPPVQDHDRNDQAGIFRSPPARGPVRAALLLEGPVAQAGDTTLSGQWRMDVLDFREAQVASPGNLSGRVRPGLAVVWDGGTRKS